MREKYLGSILGLAVNDALGMATESKTKEEIKAEFGIVKDYKKGYLPTGSYTDDSQQTIILSDSLVKNKGLVIDDYFNSLRLRTDMGRGIGPSLIRLFTGEKRNPYPSNGLAMKIAPVALFYRNQPENINPTIEKLGKLTHPHSGSVGGAVAIAQAVNYVIQHNHTSFDQNEFLTRIIENVEEYDDKLAEMIRKNKTIERMSASVYASVPNALFTFLNNPSDFEQGSIELVNSGGDTDTKASMFGAISGAYNGVESIPKRWVLGLENGNEGKDYLEELAVKLYAGSQSEKKGFFKNLMSRLNSK